jgi:hypothetical protein
MKTPVQMSHQSQYANPIDIEDAHFMRDFKRRGIKRAIQAGICFGLFVWLGILAALWWAGA